MRGERQSVRRWVRTVVRLGPLFSVIFWAGVVFGMVVYGVLQ